jgi:hypothetical protein
MTRLHQIIYWRVFFDVAPQGTRDHFSFDKVGKNEIEQLCDKVNAFFAEIGSDLRVYNLMGAIKPCFYINGKMVSQREDN